MTVSLPRRTLLRGTLPGESDISRGYRRRTDILQGTYCTSHEEWMQTAGRLAVNVAGNAEPCDSVNSSGAESFELVASFSCQP